MNDMFFLPPMGGGGTGGGASLVTGTDPVTGAAVVSGPPDMLGFSYKFGPDGDWVIVLDPELDYIVPNSAGRSVTFSRPIMVGQTVQQPSEALPTMLEIGLLAGRAMIGEAISITLPTFDRADTVAHELWRDAVLISDAPGESYILTAADVGARLMLVSRATNSGGTREVWSSSIGVVTDPAAVPVSVVLTNNGGTSTATAAATFSPPVGYAMGDTLVYIVAFNGSPTITVMSDGWREVQTLQVGATKTVVYTKIATGDDGLSFTLSATEAFALRKFAFSGRCRVLAAMVYATANPKSPDIALPMDQAAQIVTAVSCIGNAPALPSAAPEGFTQLGTLTSSTSSGGNRLYTAVASHAAGDTVTVPAWTSEATAFAAATIAVIKDPDMVDAFGTPDDVVTESSIVPLRYPVAPFFTGAGITYTLGAGHIDGIGIDASTGVVTIDRAGEGIHNISVTATNSFSEGSLEVLVHVGAVSGANPALWTNGWGGGNYYIGDTRTEIGIEMSSDSRIWTDIRAYFADSEVYAQGPLPPITEGKYVRAFTRDLGDAKLYTNVVGPQGVPDNRIARFGNSRVLYPIGEIFGTGTDRDFFFSVLWYNRDGGDSLNWLVSLGDTTQTNSHLSMHARGITNTINSSQLPNNTDASITGKEWILTTGRYWHDGTGFKTQVWCQDSISDIAAAQYFSWNRFAIGGRGDQSTSTQSSYDIACVTIGNGDPAAFHEWCLNRSYQSEKPLFRDPTMYDWDADPNAGLITYFKLHGRDRTGAMTATDFVDTNGLFAAATISTAPNWVADYPGFVDNTPIEIATPEAFIYPLISPPGVTHHLSNKWSKIGVEDTENRDVSKFTVVSLVHSTEGDISDRVQADGTFVVDEPGTLTYTLTYRRYSWKEPEVCTNTCEIIEPTPLQAAPINTDAIHGNGFVCQMPPYVSPGAGTVFASAAALQAAIIALPAGDNLIIADLDDVTGTISIPAKDFGGSIIAAENLYGVRIGGIAFAGCNNLTIRGMDVKGSVAATGVTGYVRVEHMQGRRLDLAGTLTDNAVPTSSNGTFYVDCWLCNLDAAYTNSQTSIKQYWSLDLKRSIFANSTVGDCAQIAIPHRTVMDRCFFGYSYIPTGIGAHVDGLQMHAGTAVTKAKGLIMNSVIIDPQPTDKSNGWESMQGFFLGACPKEGFLIYNCATRVGSAKNIELSSVRSNGAIVNCTAWNNSYVNSFPNAGRSENVLAGNTSTNFLNNGIAVNCTRSVSYGSWPNWNSESGNWRCFKAPPEYAGRGADNFIQALLDHEEALAA